MTAVTSIEAFRSIEAELTELEGRVLDVIKSHGADGCISDQVRGRFPELSYSSVTARFASLEAKNAICRNGDTRAGISGRQQQVMRDAKYAEKVITPIEKRPLSGFDKGVIYCAKLLAKSSDLKEAKKTILAELEKIKEKV